jgi:antitoxin (DNA-binding transcriptional repressor) of toxin-antitoxin stability system
MTTVTTHEAKTHLSKLLAKVEEGESFVISRGSKAVAMLSPLTKEEKPPRPKVGEILGDPFEFPKEAFAPMGEEDLKEWGL